MVEFLLKRGAATNLTGENCGQLHWPGHGNSGLPISRRLSSIPGPRDQAARLALGCAANRAISATRQRHSG